MIGSLALNLFVGGFMAGQWLNAPEDAGRGASTPPAAETSAGAMTPAATPTPPADEVPAATARPEEPAASEETQVAQAAPPPPPVRQAEPTPRPRPRPAPSATDRPERTPDEDYEEAMGSNSRVAPGRPMSLGYGDPRVFFRMLPFEYRRQIRRELAWRAPRVREILRDIMIERSKVMRMLTAEEVDAGELEAAFRRARELDMAFLEEVHSALIEMSVNLPPEGREILREGIQDRVEEMRDRGPRRRWRRRDREEW